MSAAVAGRQFAFIRRVDRAFSIVPAYPVLLSTYPVLRLYADNVQEVPPGSMLVPLLLVLGVATLAQLGLGRVWGETRRAALVVTAVLVPFLTFGLIADIVAPVRPSEPIVRAYLVVLVFWFTVVLLAVYVALKARRLGTLTQVFNVIATALVVLALVAIGGGALRAAGSMAKVADERSTANVATIGDARTDSGQRDIYHLVFDRYGSDESLRIGLGIDNRDFTRWLLEHGSDVVEGARANYERTAPSLSSTHGISLHDGLSARMGKNSSDVGPMYSLIRNSAVAWVLKELGFRYYHVGSWFHQTAHSDVADYFTSQSSPLPSPRR
jgi:hypothetical protein